MMILLVEDEEGIATAVKKGLLENSYSVDMTSDGKKGLRLTLRKQYSLIILDITRGEDFAWRPEYLCEPS